VLRLESLVRFDGCKPSARCVLARPDIPDIGAHCVLAILGFRSSTHHGTPGTEH